MQGHEDKQVNWKLIQASIHCNYFIRMLRALKLTTVGHYGFRMKLTELAKKKLEKKI